MAEKNEKVSQKKRVPKIPDDEVVAEFMGNLEHPLKAEVEEVRRIIKNAHESIKERIKWAAPSYYTTADLVTFNLRLLKKVHLVFHHIAITQVQSDLLEGAYKDRRMMYFSDMADVQAKEAELTRIMEEYVQLAG